MDGNKEEGWRGNCGPAVPATPMFPTSWPEAFSADPVASSVPFFIGYAKAIGRTCPPGLKCGRGIRRQRDALIWCVTFLKQGVILDP